MRIYTKTYHHSDSSNVLTDHIRHQKFGNVIIGYTNQGGFISTLDQDEKPVASFQYILPNKRLYFNKAHFLPDGTLCVLAYTMNASKRMTLYVLKIDAKGNCFHSVKLAVDNIRYISSFLLLKNNEFAIVGWYTNPGRTNDKVYIFKIDKNLQPTASRILHLGFDDQLDGAIVIEDSILLFGAQHGPAVRGFYIHLDLRLRQISSAYIENKENTIVAINSAEQIGKEIVFFGTAKSVKNIQMPLLLKARLSSKGIVGIQGIKIHWEGKGIQSRLVKSVGSEFVILNYDQSGTYYTSRLQNDFSMQSHTKVDFNSTRFNGIKSEDAALYYYGNMTQKEVTSPLLIKTNIEFECCKAVELEIKETIPLDYELVPAKLNEADLPIKMEELKIGYDAIRFSELHNCESPIPNPNENPFQLLEPYKIQSDAINLQAAGSKGRDSAQGVHLRWFLNGNLGENHIPKGNHSNNNQFFNRKDDFFKIYKIPYTQETQKTITLDIFNTNPIQVHNNETLWIYKVGDNVFNIKFIDTAKYQQLLSSINPKTQAKHFLESYGNSVVEITTIAQLSFAVNFEVSPLSSLKVETFSVANKSIAEDTLAISSRKHFTGNQTQHRSVAENIKTIRFSLISGQLNTISFEYYSEFLLNAMERNQISEIGNFALSKNDTEVFNRLEDTSKYTIDNHWLKFNEQSYVNKANYEDRWIKNDFGLKEGVYQYIALSEIDPSATKVFGEERNAEDQSEMEISLQKFINLAALDFHMARMLGLGTIDVVAKEAHKTSYIYLAAYVTDKDVDDYNLSKMCQHLYLSLPTSLATERLPQAIALEPVTYGLEIDNATETPMLITDEQGYAPYFNARYVKLKANLVDDYAETTSFFNPPKTFESSTFSSPVFLGIEHKKKPETVWRKPEIAHDRVYKDGNGNFETQTIVFDEDKVNFIHEVEEEGIGEYATYAINIFSRASGVSAIEETNYTTFKKSNTLKAPINVQVQLIQDEDKNAPLLTTPKEQDWLAAINANKKEILCRLDFDYTYNLDKNYNFGDRVGVYYRTEMPRNVIGKVIAVIEDPVDASVCTLITDSYYYISTGETITPKVEVALLDHFIGSQLTYQSKNYKVIEVLPVNADGSNPKIVIQKIESREAINTTQNQNQLMQVYETVLVNVDAAFLMVENLSTSNHWKTAASTAIQKFDFEIDLGHSQWLEKTESYIDEEQNTISETVKGIWDTAKVTSQISSGITLYTIECDNFILDHHPQYANGDISDATNDFIVNWRNGHVRIHIQSDTLRTQKRKTLDVINIKNVGTTQQLIIEAVDPNFDTNTMVNNSTEGTSISINYHPGYRTYFKEQASIDFDKNTLLPLRDEGTKYGLIGLQTFDTQTLDDSSNPYHSPVSVPAILFARELIVPQQPKKPLGPLYATPPDYFNKATYSFRTTFEHMPWGMVYYRIDTNTILSLLYTEETIKSIKDALPKTTVDSELEERWQNLLSFPTTGFETYTVADNVYTFPKPDNPDIVAAISGNTDASISDADIYLDVIHSNMLPLTEQPLIFQYMKGGTYVPQPKKQKIKDDAGKILHPTLDAEFDQSPMAKKVSDTEVAFTDFTLDANMNQDTLYFYVVREMSNSMQFGAPSPFLGPIQLLNTKAPDALVIKKLIAPIASSFDDDTAQVHFYINTFSEHQNLTHIEILRTTDSLQAINARNMNVVKTIAVEDLVTIDGVHRIIDDFENDAEVPFGIPIYYKLRAIRTLDYIDHTNSNKTQKVYSEPTKTLLTNVIDMQRPMAPELTLVNSTQNTIEFTSISLQWKKVCYYGNYKLLYLNSANVWETMLAIKTNDELDLIYTSTIPLPLFNEDDEKIYHKFKVVAESTSGLINESEIFSIP